MATVLEKTDIQGLVVSSYSSQPCAKYLLLRVEDAAKALAWLRDHVGEITNADGKGKGAKTSTNLAFTSTGLTALGLNDDVLRTFSHAFQEGMASDRRSRILGDTDENLSEKWDWGNREKMIHGVLLLYAADEALAQTQLEQRKSELADNGGFSIAGVLEAGRQPDTHEHFGFNDGIGQPVMDGTDNYDKQMNRTQHATNLATGEFLLGYINEYGVTADGPVVDPAQDPHNLLNLVPNDTTGLNSKPNMKDLGRNGTYLVFRQLAQDVPKFWEYVDQATRNGNDPTARERLAAKFVGRWKSGAPLVMSPEGDDINLATRNDFTYFAPDVLGTKCPIGSHIRRANPRDSLGPDPDTARNSANRHRILRRGRSYGPHIKDPLVSDHVDRGLHFICLNSDIERQFEFVQQTWINNPVFGGLDGEVDPLIGKLPTDPEKHKPECMFTVQGKPMRTRVDGLCRFVTVKGGAYFFLPSIRALNYLAHLPSGNTIHANRGVRRTSASLTKSSGGRIPVLITFPPSLDSELGRFLAEHYGIAHEEQPHALIFSSIVTFYRGWTVRFPLLYADPFCLVGPRGIFDYFDQRSKSELRLCPQDPLQKQQMEADWDTFNNTLAFAAARFAYYHLLPHRDMMIRPLSQGTPNFEQKAVKFAYPVFSGLLRLLLWLTADHAEESLKQARAVFKEVDDRLAKGAKYLVGDRLTLSDLAFAVAAAPLVLPPTYGGAIPSYDQMPVAVKAAVNEFRPRPAGVFALRVYEEYRQRFTLAA
jgi:Dyp-type peroxidase family